MRLLAFILNVLIAASSLASSEQAFAATENETSRVEFQQNANAKTNNKNTLFKKRSHNVGNLWERIRLGMQLPRPLPPSSVLSAAALLINANMPLKPPLGMNNKTTEVTKKDNPAVRLHNQLTIRRDSAEIGRINAIIETAAKPVNNNSVLVVADNSNNLTLTPEQQEALKKQQAEKRLFEQRQLERETAIYERVNKQIIRYSQNKNYLYEIANRAKPYLYHVVNGLSQNQLPLELALLPIVESAYQPTAQSSKSAAGLWQFIASTGWDFDLKQTQNYDDRLDITASTQAAIKYLALLKRHFKGDWLLALAAYNCGLGEVDEAIKKNTLAGLATDYWSLNLPEETQNYVPRLLALSSIFADPARYGFNFAPIKNEPYFVQVRIEKERDVQYLASKNFNEIAELANLSYEQFMQLNPGYLNASPALTEAFTFLIPVSQANLLQRRLNTVAKLAETDTLAHLNTPSKSRASNNLKTELSIYASIATPALNKMVKLARPFISLNISSNKTTPRIMQPSLMNAALSLNALGV